MDECEEGLHSCQPEVEVCVNQIGKYKCQVVVQASQYDTLSQPPFQHQVQECPSGFGYDPSTSQCRGEIYSILLYVLYLHVTGWDMELVPGMIFQPDIYSSLLNTVILSKQCMFCEWLVIYSNILQLSCGKVLGLSHILYIFIYSAKYIVFLNKYFFLRKIMKR